MIMTGRSHAVSSPRGWTLHRRNTLVHAVHRQVEQHYQ